MGKEKAVTVSENEGNCMMHKSKEVYREGSYDGLLNTIEIRARVQKLKVELDELSRIVGCGSIANSKMLYCYECGIGVDEESLAPKELSLKVALTKDKEDNDSRTKANQEVRPWSNEGEPNIVNLKSQTLGMMDTTSPADGLLSVEQDYYQLSKRHDMYWQRNQFQHY